MGAALNALWILLGTLAGVLALTPLIRRLDAAGHPLGGTLRAVRNLLIPMAALLLLAVLALGWDAGPDAGPDGKDHPLTGRNITVRILETLLWIVVIHVVLSSASATLFAKAGGSTWRARVPKLFLDLARSSLVLLGIAFVLSAVWGKDLGTLLTALGVGSIVLGLALQDTLGNLMAGIALLFEKPFGIGDWIKVQERIGKVTNMNWRAVRILTRSRDELIVPNSILGKEIIQNLSKPTGVHAEYQGDRVLVRRSAEQGEARAAEGGALDPGHRRGPGPEGPHHHVRGLGRDLPDPVLHRGLRPAARDRGRVHDPDLVRGRQERTDHPFPIRTVFKSEVPPVPPVDATAGAKAALSPYRSSCRSVPRSSRRSRGTRCCSRSPAASGSCSRATLATRSTSCARATPWSRSATSGDRTGRWRGSRAASSSARWRC